MKDFDDDFDWLTEMEGVERLENNTFVDKTTPKDRKKAEDADEIREAYPNFQNPNAFLEKVPMVDVAFKDENFVDRIRTEENLAARRESVGVDMFERLKKGLFPFELKLDLHGRRESEASEILLGFLNKSYALGLRCVLIVHGKGKGYGEQGDMGIIKANVPMWLECSSAVMAYYTALPKHGGSGAVYVLLRRKKQENWIKEEDF